MKSEEKKTQEGSGNGTSKSSFVAYVIQFGLSIFAAYLNWRCMANQGMIIRVVVTVLAFIFAVYYLIFYLIFKVIMGQTC